MRSFVSIGSHTTSSVRAGSRRSPPARTHLGKLKVPFLNTAPLTDLHLLIGLAAVWWVLGVEQFVALPVLVWSAVKYFLLGKKIAISPPLLLLLAIIVSMLLSATAIDSGVRSVTFVRTFAMYAMGVLVAIIVSGECTTPAKVRSLLRTVTLMMGIASGLGLLGVLGIAELRFRSPMGQLLPSVLADTGYGQQIVWRTLGNHSWFQGLGNYFRVSSIFLFSTMWAAATAVTLPVAAYFAYTERGISKLVHIAITVLIAVGLVFSTGRVAWIAVSAAVAFMTFIAMRALPRASAVLIAAAAIASTFLVVPYGFWSGTVQDVLYARGAGSTNSRLTIYRATIDGILERPLIGWGTERDITTVDDFELPAGSHSYYLGFVYKHGLLGLALLVSFLAVITMRLRGRSRSGPSVRSDRPGVLLLFVRCSLLTAALIGLTSALDLDATLALVIWTILFGGLQLANLTAQRQLAVASAGDMIGRGR